MGDAPTTPSHRHGHRKGNHTTKSEMPVLLCSSVITITDDPVLSCCVRLVPLLGDTVVANVQ